MNGRSQGLGRDWDSRKRRGRRRPNETINAARMPPPITTPSFHTISTQTVRDSSSAHSSPSQRAASGMLAMPLKNPTISSPTRSRPSEIFIMAEAPALALSSSVSSALRAANRDLRSPRKRLRSVGSSSVCTSSAISSSLNVAAPSSAAKVGSGATSSKPARSMARTIKCAPLRRPGNVDRVILFRCRPRMSRADFVLIQHAFRATNPARR